MGEKNPPKINNQPTKKKNQPKNPKPSNQNKNITAPHTVRRDFSDPFILGLAANLKSDTEKNPFFSKFFVLDSGLGCYFTLIFNLILLKAILASRAKQVK